MVKGDTQKQHFLPGEVFIYVALDCWPVFNTLNDEFT